MYMHVVEPAGQGGTRQIIKRTTYPLISWVHRMAGADHFDAAGHRASSDSRLWAHAPDPEGRSDSVAWPKDKLKSKERKGNK